MGKGARNRAARKANLGLNGEPPRGQDAAILELLDLDSDADFERLIARSPEALSAATFERLEELSEFDGFGVVYASLAELVRDARNDSTAAWARYRRGVAERNAMAGELEADVEEIERAVEESRVDDVIANANDLLSRANSAGLGLAVGLLHEQRGQALLQTATGDRGENMEQAIEDFERALWLSVNPEHAAQRAMHVALAYSERIYGDRAENLERAVGLLRTGLGELDESCAPETWAIVRTNLAMALIRRERGDRAENLR